MLGTGSMIRKMFPTEIILLNVDMRVQFPLHNLILLLTLPIKGHNQCEDLVEETQWLTQMQQHNNHPTHLIRYASDVILVLQNYITCEEIVGDTQWVTQMQQGINHPTHLIRYAYIKRRAHSYLLLIIQVYCLEGK